MEKHGKGKRSGTREEAPAILVKSRLSRLLRVIAVAGVSATVFGGCAWVPTWTGRVSFAGNAQASARAGGPEEFDVKAACAAVIKAHNRIRAENKLPALTISTKLQAAAQKHAEDMASNRKMTHKGSDGSTAIKRIVSKGYNYRRAGENIAAGQFTVDALMKGWMESPHHKRNILGSFSQIGVACAIDPDGKRYWCVTFGLPARR
jgi:uncharacterized protein YkwD